jgi:hypothetical protein
MQPYGQNAGTHPPLILATFLGVAAVPGRLLGGCPTSRRSRGGDLDRALSAFL